ncbi:hypothetical protein D3C87_2086740 [compost metagenome]
MRCRQIIEMSLASVSDVRAGNLSAVKDSLRVSAHTLKRRIVIHLQDRPFYHHRQVWQLSMRPQV